MAAFSFEAKEGSKIGWTSFNGSKAKASETLFLIDSKVQFKSAFIFPTWFQMSSSDFDLNFGGDGENQSIVDSKLWMLP